jgi:hypothetical protein
MKKYILTAILIVAAIVVSWSQKVITKKLDVQGKKVEMKFDFAENIRVEAWDKNTVELEVSVDIDNNRYNDYYALNVNEFTGSADLIEKVDFEGIKKVKDQNDCCNFQTKINYKLKVPADLEFNLKTISGKIELLGSLGKMSINSISGFIDYTVPAALKARINLSTVTGDVYSNVKFDSERAKQMPWVGTKRDLTLNGGTLPVKLETVSGNIYLRKSKQMN